RDAGDHFSKSPLLVQSGGGAGVTRRRLMGHSWAICNPWWLSARSPLPLILAGRCSHTGPIVHDPQRSAMPAGSETKPLARAVTASQRSVRRRARAEAAADGGRLNAMGKAFSILEIVSAARQPLSMADIVRRTGLTKPTAHRITTLLSEMGFI